MLQLQKRLKETQEIKCFKQKKPKQEIAIRFVFYKLQPNSEGYTKLGLTLQQGRNDSLGGAKFV